MASPIYLLLLLVLLSVLSTTVIASPPILYAHLCSSIVPQSPPSAQIPNTNNSFFFNSAYITGADEFLAARGGGPGSKIVSFYPKKLYSTAIPGTLMIEGTLNFRVSAIGIGGSRRPGGRSLRRVVSLPKRRQPWGFIKLELSGFWSDSSGKLCMVGSGLGGTGEGQSNGVSAVFKLNYTRKSDITNVVVVGSVESLEGVGSPGYFSPIHMFLYARRDYEYSLIPQVKKMNAELGVVGDPLAFGANNKVCLLMKSVADAGGMELEYRVNCGKVNCNPPGMVGALNMVSLRDIQCDLGGRLHFYMLFSNGSYSSRQLDPTKMLLGEGVWDQERSRFTIAACCLRSLTEIILTGSAIRDCEIGVSLWFPKSLTVENRNLLFGQIWSEKSKNDSDYFEKIVIHGSDYYMGVIPGLKYNFTKKNYLDRACTISNLNNSVGNMYPDRLTFRDLTFHFSVKDSKGDYFRGSMSLYSIGETIYDRFFSEDGTLPSAMLSEMNKTSWSVSYKITFPYWGSSPLPEELTDISAEGVYNPQNGVVCLVGCRTLLEKQRKGVGSTDCEMLINVQLPAVNRIGEAKINGSIRSTRQKKDPLYFNSLEISSYVMYHNDAVETIWRMDMEMTMVLISLTLQCIFIGSQLLYVRKNPLVLSSISLMMLIILTLGHMVPLVLNFEALFVMNHSKQSTLLLTGGWLEANEVIVRIVTMVAFLLQFRLLQLTWSARSTEEHKEGLWTAERKSIQICLPLYFIGIIIAWLFNLGFYKSKSPIAIGGARNHDLLWGDMMVFCGLVLDGFLLPQIFFNVFWDSKEKSLAHAYYFGTTAVRAVPHMYDVYRAHSRIGQFGPTYLYASPKEGLFSTGWDIFIPLFEFVLATVVFLQQKFGGRAIHPLRFRKGGGYEAVPVTGG